jgi:hypothetical protein
VFLLTLSMILLLQLLLLIPNDFDGEKNEMVS